MGLGAFPASDPQWLGMLGMHGAYEANHAMHDCDVMVVHRRALRRPGDRPARRLLAGLAQDPHRHRPLLDRQERPRRHRHRRRRGHRARGPDRGSGRRPRRVPTQAALADWWRQIDAWRARKSFGYRDSDSVIKPQYAIERLYALTKDRDVYITTEVGQHQMWAAQFFHFEEPNRWMTSGGLGTMGYGLPAAVGVQMAHPEAWSSTSPATPRCR